jgi:hypothetical protein
MELSNSAMFLREILPKFGILKNIKILEKKLELTKYPIIAKLAIRMLGENFDGTGVLGFEPRDGETKTRCLTAWRHPNIIA